MRMNWINRLAAATAITCGLFCLASPSIARQDVETGSKSDSTAKDVTSDGPVEKNKLASQPFESPILLKAKGKPIRVESPGYACPTIFDVDADGKPDLVVGQFNGGNLKFFKNIADSQTQPEYIAGEWLKTGSQRAEVPGVW